MVRPKGTLANTINLLWLSVGPPEQPCESHNAADCWRHRESRVSSRDQHAGTLRTRYDIQPGEGNLDLD